MSGPSYPWQPYGARVKSDKVSLASSETLNQDNHMPTSMNDTHIMARLIALWHVANFRSGITRTSNQSLDLVMASPSPALHAHDSVNDLATFTHNFEDIEYMISGCLSFFTRRSATAYRR